MNWPKIIVSLTDITDQMLKVLEARIEEVRRWTDHCRGMIDRWQGHGIHLDGQLVLVINTGLHEHRMLQAEVEAAIRLIGGQPIATDQTGLLASPSQVAQTVLADGLTWSLIVVIGLLDGQPVRDLADYLSTAPNAPGLIDLTQAGVRQRLFRNDKPGVAQLAALIYETTKVVQNERQQEGAHAAR